MRTAVRIVVVLLVLGGIAMALRRFLSETTEAAVEAEDRESQDADLVEEPAEELVEAQA